MTRLQSYVSPSSYIEEWQGSAYHESITFSRHCLAARVKHKPTLQEEVCATVQPTLLSLEQLRIIWWPRRTLQAHLGLGAKGGEREADNQQRREKIHQNQVIK